EYIQFHLHTPKTHLALKKGKEPDCLFDDTFVFSCDALIINLI
ncbi:MAG: hypothetical protein ACJA1Z_003045, partial [Patiriisocius sp.]